MSEFLFILGQIAAVFFAFFIAFLYRKYRNKKIDLDVISDLIIYLASPALIFYKIATTKYSFTQIGTLVGAMIFLILGMGLLMLLWSKKSKVFAISTMFMNTANVGFPVTLFVLGPKAFEQAIILDLVMIILMFSLGVGLMSGKFSEWLKLPVIYAAALGFIISFSGWAVPEFVLKPFAMIGELTVPLMIVSLGCKVADIKKIKHFGIPIAATLLRSLGGLALGLIYVGLFQISGLTRSVILLYAALPAPVMTYILAQKYHQEENTAAEIVLVSNLAAVIILPLVLFLIR